MELRLECYGYERDAAVAAISEQFNVKSVSKAYPNLRQTSVEGTPCENRYYIKLNASNPVKQTGSLRDMLTLDMLRTMAVLQDSFGMDMSGEIPGLRELYMKSGEFTDRQLTELFLEYKRALFGRHAKRKGA